MYHSSIKYVSDEKGKLTAVMIPIELWQEIESEKETAYLLKSKNMKQRLVQAKKRKTGISLKTVHEKFGI